MPEAKSGRVDILRQLAVPGGVAAEDTGNHFLLRLTRRSERCRSGSQISGAGLYQRQGAEGRSRGVEGCGIRDELIIAAIPSHQVRKSRVASSSCVGVPGFSRCLRVRTGPPYRPRQIRTQRNALIRLRERQTQLSCVCVRAAPRARPSDGLKLRNLPTFL